MKWRIPFFRGRSLAAEKAFVHIGPHKTGTTHIQHVLLNAGDRIHYPEPECKGPGHAYLAGQMIHPETALDKKNVLIESIRRKKSQQFGIPHVFSAERFTECALIPHAVKQFAELSEFIHSELIITHRPIQQRAYSILQERVKQGIIQDFREREILWDNVFRQSWFSEQFLDRVVGMAGWRKVHIVMVDGRQPHFLTDAFSRILGVPLSPTTVPDHQNARLPYMQMMFLLALHQEQPGLDMHVQIERSKIQFEALATDDPVMAATPYPPIPDKVYAYAEALEASMCRRMDELEAEGIVTIHRPSAL
jgi:hypothetical protein